MGHAHNAQHAAAATADEQLKHFNTNLRPTKWCARGTPARRENLRPSGREPFKANSVGEQPKTYPKFDRLFVLAERVGISIEPSPPKSGHRIGGVR
jgi:hypothetical protein